MTVNAVIAALAACIPEPPGPWAPEARGRWLNACAAIFDFFYPDVAPEPANMPEIMPPVIERRTKGKQVLWLAVRDAVADGEVHSIRDVARGLIAAGRRQSVKQLSSQIYGRCLVGHPEEFRSPAEGKIQLRAHLDTAPATTEAIAARINELAEKKHEGALWRVVRSMLVDRGEPMPVAELARLTGKPVQTIYGRCLREHPETFRRPQPGMLALPETEQMAEAREQAVAALRGLGEKNGHAQECVEHVLSARPDLATDPQAIVREAFRLAKEAGRAQLANVARRLGEVNGKIPA